MSKAFDKVWHKGLIYKLKQNGINKQLLKWLTNYIYKRNQQVVLNGVTSAPEYIGAGVPQGSILGPLLFLVYVNDIYEGLENSVRLYIYF